jgi:hypothetical protein
MNDLEVFNKLSELDKPGLQQFLVDIEKKFRALPPEQLITDKIPIIHHFSKDVYAREMRQPKDSLVLGKIHKYENLCIISSGEVSIMSVDGVVKVKAPYTFVASPGAQRIIFAHEDTTWTVIHGTNEKDVEKIEEKFIAKSYEEFHALQQSQVIPLIQEAKEKIA